MGIRLTQTAPDRPVEILPDGKGDQALAQYIARLIQRDIDEKAARERPSKPDSKLEKAVATITRDGMVSAISKSSAISELSKAAETWESRARDYSDPDLRAYTFQKAQAARAEIARLEGREIPEPEARRAARPVTVSIPR